LLLLCIIPPPFVLHFNVDVSLFRYGVKSGTDLEDWEEKGWITCVDPYGERQQKFDFKKVTGYLILQKYIGQD
jgi:hypothetical protein